MKNRWKYVKIELRHFQLNTFSAIFRKTMKFFIAFLDFISEKSFSQQKNAEFILTIPEAGNYQISVTGHQAKGKVSFARLAPQAEP